MFPLQGSGLGGGDIYDNGAHHRVASHREPRTRQQGSRRPSTLAQEVAKRFQVAGHSAYPVVDSDDGHLVGIITRSLLLRDDDWSSVTPIQDIAFHDVVTITPNDSVSDALQKMVEEQIEHLPVIDGGRLVGICTRTDVMRARQTQWAHEQPEPGWRRRNRPGISGPPNLNTDEDGEA